MRMNRRDGLHVLAAVSAGLVAGACPGLVTFLVDATVAIGSLPTEEVRIAGTNYIDLAKKDSTDRAYAQGGQLCVVHNPGCGWWGNSGTDEFFAQKPLPPLANLVRVEFTPYFPSGLGPGTGGPSWANGSYLVELGDTNGSLQPPYVDWANTCWGRFGGKDIVYSVSFIVLKAKQADLGEPTFSPLPLADAPCKPADYTADRESVVTPMPPFYLRRQDLGPEGGNVVWANTFGVENPGAGKVVAIQNLEPFRIVLIADTSNSEDCFEPASPNVALDPQQSTTAMEITELYGTVVAFPRPILACAHAPDAQRPALAVKVEYTN